MCAEFSSFVVALMDVLARTSKQLGGLVQQKMLCGASTSMQECSAPAKVNEDVTTHQVTSPKNKFE